MGKTWDLIAFDVARLLVPDIWDNASPKLCRHWAFRESPCHQCTVSTWIQANSPLPGSTSVRREMGHCKRSLTNSVLDNNEVWVAILSRTITLQFGTETTICEGNSAHHMSQRLTWVKERHHWTLEAQIKIAWTGESRLQLVHADGRVQMHHQSLGAWIPLANRVQFRPVVVVVISLYGDCLHWMKWDPWYIYQRPSLVNDTGTRWQIVSAQLFSSSTLQETCTYSETMHPAHCCWIVADWCGQHSTDMRMHAWSPKAMWPQSYWAHLGCCQSCVCPGSCSDKFQWMIGDFAKVMGQYDSPVSQCCVVHAMPNHHWLISGQKVVLHTTNQVLYL